MAKVDWRTLRDGDTVTVTDTNGQTLRGKVTGDNGVYRIVFGDLGVVFLNGAWNPVNDSYTFSDLERKPEPKPWAEAPNGSYAIVGDSRDIAYKDFGIWYWYMTGGKVSQRSLDTHYVELVEKPF